MVSFTYELKSSWRRILRKPLYSLVSVILLALGLGCALGVYSLLHAMLFRPLPVPGGGRVVRITTPEAGLSYPDFLEHRSNRALDALVLSQSSQFSLRVSDLPERVQGAWVSAGFFEDLGLRPTLGQALLGAEGGNPDPVALVSHHFWVHRFRSDPGVLGTLIRANGRDWRIVGVGPRGFRGVEVGFPQDLFLPIPAQPVGDGGAPPTQDRARTFPVVGRLRPGASLAEANAEARLIVSRLPQWMDGGEGVQSPTFQPDWVTRKGIAGGFIHQPWVIGAAAVLMMVLSCVAVSGLQLAEAIRRRREFVIRLALGASPGRGVVSSLVEAAILASTGALLGLAMGKMLAVQFVSHRGAFFGVSDLEVPITASVWGAALLGVIFATIIVGAAPSLVLARTTIRQALQDGSGASAPSRGREILTMLQVGLSIALLIAALSILRQARSAQSAPLGYASNQLLAMKFSIDPTTMDRERTEVFQQALLSRVREVPGVESGTLACAQPMDTFSFFTSIQLTSDTRPMKAPALLLGADYAKTLGVTVLEGREFNERDRRGAPPVAMVNEAFARRYFPGRSPIGSSLNPSSPNGRQIVGVLANHAYLFGVPQAAPMVYIPLSQLSLNFFSVLVRSPRPQAILGEVRRVAAVVAPDLAPLEVHTVDQFLFDRQAPRRMASVLLGILGLCSLAITLAGIGGMLVVNSQARRREWGIRLALGDGGWRLGLSVVGYGMRLGAVGACAGALVAVACVRWMAHKFDPDFSLKVIDVFVPMVGGSFMLLVMTALPAMRAAWTNPADVLRDE